MDKLIRPSLTLDLEKKLAKILRDLETSLAENVFWESVIDQACAALSTQTGTMFRLSENGQELVIVAHYRLSPGKLEQAHFPITKGICGWIARNRQVACVNDVAKDARFNSEVDVVTEFKTLAILGAPVAIPQRLYGVIEVLNPGQRAFTSSDTEFLEALGGAAGALFHRLNLPKPS